VAERHKHTNSVNYIADLLDSRCKIPGTRIKFGIDPILGLIPGVGDWFGGMLSIYFMIEAFRAGGGLSVVLRIFLNIILDIIIGSIPLIGEVFDVAWKANRRNAKLIQNLHTEQKKTEKRSKWFVGLVIVLLTGIILGLIVTVVWLIAQLLSLLTT